MKKQEKLITKLTEENQNLEEKINSIENETDKINKKIPIDLSLHKKIEISYHEYLTFLRRFDDFLLKILK